jgi:hypothetical protein
MSNERRNPYHKKKNHKNTSSLATAAIVTRAAAARMNGTNKMMSAARDINRTSGNKMNVSIEYDASAGLNDLNESMISTVSSVNPQDLDQTTIPVTQDAAQTNGTNHTYITNLEATMEHKAITATNTGNTQSPASNVPGRVLLVDNQSPTNPNDVETFALQLRQYSTGTRF